MKSTKRKPSEPNRRKGRTVSPSFKKNSSRSPPYLTSSYKSKSNVKSEILQLQTDKSDNPFFTPMSRLIKTEKKETTAQNSDTEDSEEEEPVLKTSKKTSMTAAGGLRKQLCTELVRYDGSRNVVLLNNFCRRLGGYFRCAELSDEQQVLFASSLLNKSAESWIAASPTFDTFNEFKSALMQQFRPPNTEEEARAELVAFSQKGSASSSWRSFKTSLS